MNGESFAQPSSRTHPNPSINQVNSLLVPSIANILFWYLSLRRYRNCGRSWVEPLYEYAPCEDNEDGDESAEDGDEPADASIPGVPVLDLPDAFEE